MSVSQFGVSVNCAKMAELITVPFGADLYGPNKPCIRWDSGPLMGRDNFDDGYMELDQRYNYKKMVIPDYVQHASMLAVADAGKVADWLLFCC